MIKTLVFLLLLSLAASYGRDRYDFSLSPTIPPPAFLGQYYTCDFRVAGLKNPVYTFERLPRFLKGSSIGRLEGTPNERGNYEIIVHYEEGIYSGRKQVILRVADVKRQEKQVAKVKDEVTVEYNLNNIELIPCVYTQDQQVLINLNQYYPGKNVWSYEHLPSSLEGSKDGLIKGRFANKGYYSFAAVCSDEKGISSNYVFTLNVQPSIYTGYYYYGYQQDHYMRNTELVSVPVRNTCECNAIMAADLQKSALADLIQARNAFDQARLELQKVKAIIFKIKTDFALAEKNLKLSTLLRDKMMKLQAKALKKAIHSRQWLKKAKNFFQLTKTNYLEHKEDLVIALKKLKFAQQCLQIKKKAFDKANDQFIKAQKEVDETISEIKSLKLEVILAKKDVKGYFKFVKVAKRNLLKAEHALANMKMDTENMKNEKDIAAMENDIATSQFHNAEDDVKKAADALKKANQKIVDLRVSKDNAGKELGKAQFNLNQAMNNLLVAQAAKEQSDKNIAMATAQLKHRDTEPRTYIFSGCDIQGYPSYSGSQLVESIEDGKVLLRSGHYLLYGGCTDKGKLKKGDLVNFEGYWKNGCIHGVKLSI